MDKETVRNLVEEAILTRKDSIGERSIPQINGYFAFVDFDEKQMRFETLEEYIKTEHLDFVTAFLSYIMIRNICVDVLKTPASSFFRKNNSERILDACDLQKDLEIIRNAGPDSRWRKTNEDDLTILERVAGGDLAAIENKPATIKEYYLRVAKLMYPERIQ